MRVIAHISDLHFGTENAAVAEQLVADLAATPPSVVVCSGDLTQRARQGQFAAARAFLDRLPRPQLVIPGNHDVPLYDVVRRFASPLGNYRRIITPDLDPTFEDDELFIAGVNTARSLTWKSGRISDEQIAGLRRSLRAAGTGRFKVVVTHHPFIPPPENADAGIDLGRAAQALAVLDECEVDLLLAGHLHHGYAGDTRTYYPAARRSIISAQAGTTISRRVRHEPNAYNRITLDRTHILLEVRAWDGAAFCTARSTHYELRGSAWTAVTPEAQQVKVWGGAEPAAAGEKC